jgi:hypothetical protein
MWSRWLNQNWQEKRKYGEEACPSATLSTKNLSWPDLGSDHPGGCGNQTTNHLHYGMALTALNLRQKSEKVGKIVNEINM